MKKNLKLERGSREKKTDTPGVRCQTLKHTSRLEVKPRTVSVRHRELFPLGRGLTRPPLGACTRAFFDSRAQYENYHNGGRLHHKSAGH